MAKIIPFRPSKEEQKSIHKLLELGQQIDDVILRYMQDPDVDPRELAGILSHRLGTLMAGMDERSELWEVCERVMKRQAKID